VYAYLARIWRHSEFTPVSIRTKGVGKEAAKVYGPPLEAYWSAARLLLLQDAQAGLDKGSLEGLATEDRKYDLGGFEEKTIITVGGRQKKYVRVAYDESKLPVIPP
jgi:hypothetical protein